MNTHNTPNTQGTRPHVKTAERRIPEWVRRAQAGQLVRKDMTGTVVR